MASLPREPEAFSEQVCVIARRSFPDRDIEVSGLFELHMSGRRVSLENLYRMVQSNPDRGVEIVEEYFDHLLEGEEASTIPMPLDVARLRIMPRIQPESIFEHLDRELVVHQPFVNNTVVLYVMDMPHLTYSITVEQMMRWGLCVDEIDEIARENLRAYAPELEIRLVETDGGRAAILSRRDGYDASRLLLSNLYGKLAPRLGGNFYVATPSRDTFVALSIDPPNFTAKVHQRVERDFKRLPYPITDKYFLVTMDGVAGTEELSGNSSQAA